MAAGGNISQPQITDVRPPVLRRYNTRYEVSFLPALFFMDNFMDAFSLPGDLRKAPENPGREMWGGVVIKCG